MKPFPLHNFVLVKQQESEDSASSGISAQDTATEQPEQGEVVAASASNGVTDDGPRSFEVKIGDQVLFGKHAGHPVEIDGSQFLVVREDDLIAEFLPALRYGRDAFNQRNSL